METKEEKQLKEEILECKTCKVRKGDLSVYPVSSYDSFAFDNFCLNHKVAFIELATKLAMLKEIGDYFKKKATMCYSEFEKLRSMLLEKK